MSLTSLGLLLDILGVLLLTLTDLPRGDLMTDGTRIVQEQGDESSRKVARFRVATSRGALILILLGFSLQFWGAVCP